MDLPHAAGLSPNQRALRSSTIPFINSKIVAPLDLDRVEPVPSVQVEPPGSPSGLHAAVPHAVYINMYHMLTRIPDIPSGAFP